MNLPHNFERLLDNGYGKMGPVVDQSRYVVFRHLGKLLLEDTFQASQDDRALTGVVVIDDSEFDIAIALFFDSRLVSESECHFPKFSEQAGHTFSGKGTTLGLTSPSGVGDEERESLTRFVGLAPSGCSVALRLFAAQSLVI